MRRGTSQGSRSSERACVAVVNERRLLERLVPAELLGRVFGVERALVTGAFALSYLAAGVLVAAIGPRALFACGGLVALAAASWALVVLRPTLGEPKPALA